jgi:hypothetical protein
LVCALCALPFPAAAEEAPSEAAVRELFETADLGAAFDETMSGLVDPQAIIQSDPELAKHPIDVEAYVKRYTSWTSVEPTLVKSFLRQVTAKELREMQAFAKTAAGRKLLHAQFGLLQLGIRTGQQLVDQNIKELSAQMARDEEVRRRLSQRQATPDQVKQ